MKYKDLIKQLEPFADKDVDLALDGRNVEFWIDGGDFLITEVELND